MRPLHEFEEQTPALAEEVNENFEEVWAYPTRYTAVAGETINGETLPVPVYINTSNGRVLACKADDYTKVRFVGFAVTDATNGEDIEVIANGIVSGFSGLSVGQVYYVSNTAGVLATTPGETSITVGVAKSATEMMIKKTPLSRPITWTKSGTGTEVVNLGFRARKIYGLAKVSDSNSGATNGLNASSPNVPGSSTSVTMTYVAWEKGNHNGYTTTYSTPSVITDNTTQLASVQNSFNNRGIIAITSVTDTSVTFTVSVSNTPYSGPYSSVKLIAEE